MPMPRPATPQKAIATVTGQLCESTLEVPAMPATSSKRFLQFLQEMRRILGIQLYHKLDSDSKVGSRSKFGNEFGADSIPNFWRDRPHYLHGTFLFPLARLLCWFGIRRDCLDRIASALRGYSRRGARVGGFARNLEETG